MHVEIQQILLFLQLVESGDQPIRRGRSFTRSDHITYYLKLIAKQKEILMGESEMQVLERTLHGRALGFFQGGLLPPLRFLKEKNVGYCD